MSFSFLKMKYRNCCYSEVWLFLCLTVFQKLVYGNIWAAPSQSCGKLGMLSHSAVLSCLQANCLWGNRISSLWILLVENTMLSVSGNPQFGFVNGFAVRLFSTLLSQRELCEFPDCVWLLGERVLRKKGRILFRAVSPVLSEIVHTGCPMVCVPQISTWSLVFTAMRKLHLPLCLCFPVSPGCIWKIT